jgi:hypothetical protein
MRSPLLIVSCILTILARGTANALSSVTAFTRFNVVPMTRDTVLRDHTVGCEFIKVHGFLADTVFDAIVEEAAAQRKASPHICQPRRSRAGEETTITRSRVR